MDALSVLQAKGITTQKLDLQNLKDQKPELYANIMDVLFIKKKAPRTVPQLYLNGEFAGDSSAIKRLQRPASQK
jgi:glutaredoxin-related protein